MKPETPKDPSLSGRWHGQLMTLRGHTIDVTVALQSAAGGAITGEFFAYYGAKEFHGKFSGSIENGHLTLKGPEGASFDANLHYVQGVQFLTGVATFGSAAGSLSLQNVPQVERLAAWGGDDGL